MRIDAHHHYWNYNPVEYDWIDDNMKVIRCSFLPDDLKHTIETAGIDGVITVQARQSLEETEWLLDLADKNDFMKGIVGWVPLTAGNIASILEKYAHHNKLKAVRHVVQGETDDNFILRDNFNRGISLLKKFDLTYDILIFERHLPQTIEFVDRHPEQLFVVDHIAKPLIKDNILEPWSGNLRELAKRENVYCKISGMVTEADFNNWTEAQLQPYLNTVIEAFGPNRVMFGSDWPVCLVTCEYARWVTIVETFISKLTFDEQTKIMGENARTAYRTG